MKNATMLYRCPGPHETEGVRYAYVIVDDAEVQEKLAAGWHADWVAADAAHKAAADKLQANEQELAEVEAKLQAAPKARKAKG